jgi:hypothetical protein
MYATIAANSSAAVILVKVSVRFIHCLDAV